MDWIFISLILLGLGVGVIIMELFIPSAGVLGVIATILIVSGVVVAFFKSMIAGATVLALTVLSLPMLFALLIKVWPNTPIGRRVLIGNFKEQDVLPLSEAYTEYHKLVGQLGVAKTKMLPSGLIVVNDKKYDAVSDGFPIEAGQPIKIIAVKGNRIFVQPYEGDLEDAEDLPARDNDILSQPIEDLGLQSFDDPLE